MNTPITFVERRQRLRTGILAEIENITYRVLRDHGIDGTTEQQSSNGTTEPSV